MIRELDVRQGLPLQAPGSEAGPGAGDLRLLRMAHGVARVAGVSARTGSPTEVRFEKAVAEPPELVERALVAVQELIEATGRGGAGSRLEFVPDAQVHHTSAGAQVVHLYQHCLGVPIFEAVRIVRFDSLGGLRSMGGDHVPISAAVDVRPTLAVADAVSIAASHVEGDRSRTRKSRIIASFPLPSRPSLLRHRAFRGEVSAHLTLLCRRRALELGWLVSFALPDGDEYDLIVAANGATAGEILYCRRTLDQARGRGRVYRSNPDEAQRQWVDFPVALDEYPLPLPETLSPSFPGDWINGRSTRGNNVAAFPGNRNRALQGKRIESRIVFDPQSGLSRDQCLLNAFYFCNYLHDFFYLLGFDESEGNFQEINFSGAPGDDDGLVVRIFDTVFEGGASMRSRQDGRRAELDLGRIAESNRPAALDADVVFHEFVHGVTNRMVGGRHNLSPLRHPQSHALAEGISDYFALTIQNYGRPQSEAKVVLGAWVANQAGGLRNHPFDEAFPGHFGLLGREPFREPHDAGEIWCMALLRVNRNLGRAFDSEDLGHQVGWQLVVDSLKLMPTGPDAPSFLDARDALLAAGDDFAAGERLEPEVAERIRPAILEVFTGLGMGPAAVCRGATLDFFEPDFGETEDLAAVPSTEATPDGRS